MEEGFLFSCPGSGFALCHYVTVSEMSVFNPSHNECEHVGFSQRQAGTFTFLLACKAKCKYRSINSLPARLSLFVATWFEMQHVVWLHVGREVSLIGFRTCFFSLLCYWCLNRSLSFFFFYLKCALIWSYTADAVSVNTTLKQNGHFEQCGSIQGGFFLF